MTTNALRMSEAQLQAAIVQAATALGYLCYHTHDSRRFIAADVDYRRQLLAACQIVAERGDAIRRAA